MNIVRSLAEQNQLEAQQSEDATAEMLRLMAQFQQQRNTNVVTQLALHIKKRWEILRTDNRQVRQDTIKLLRRTRGEYEPEKRTAIRAMRGSEAFVRSSEAKARAAYSWITDIYRGDTDLPWSLEPTAVPSLPNETQENIKAEIMQRGIELQAQKSAEAAAAGVPFDPATIAKTMSEWQEVAEKKAIEQILASAKKRLLKAETKIRDNNQEGGWEDAFKDFLWYFIRVKAGIIKGPILTMKKKNVWAPDGNGGFSIVTEEVLANDVYCVSPFNFFPSRHLSNPNDGGDLIETHELTRQSLSELMKVDGYSAEEISIVLRKLKSGEQKANWLAIEDETQVKQVQREKNLPQGNPSTAVTVATDMSQKIQAIEYWGTVPGSMLIEWGLTNGINPDEEYQANCWNIGEHVIKAVINPDRLGRKPYHVSSWCKNPSWILGEGLIEFAEPIEDVMNSIVRALQNNIAIASGPQVEVNIDRCTDKSPIYPWKKWESTGSQMRESKALEFYQPSMHANELIQAYEFFSKVLDEMTVPAYAQGASQSGVTAGTATVFTQLLAAASRSIKSVVANIDDDVIKPYIQMCYDALMLDTDDDDMKGDATVVAKGVSGLLAKEQQAQRKTEFLQVVANPTFSQVLGAKNLGYILGEIAKSNDLHLPDAERLEGTPSLEELLTKMNMQTSGLDAMQATGQIGAGGTPTAPQATTMDGAPAGAPDMQQPAQIGA